MECNSAGVDNVAHNYTDYVQAFMESKERRMLDAMMAEERVTKTFFVCPEIFFGRNGLQLCGRKPSFWLCASCKCTGWHPRIVWRALSLKFHWHSLPSWRMSMWIYTSCWVINGGVSMVYVTTMFNAIVSVNGFCTTPLESERHITMDRHPSRTSRTLLSRQLHWFCTYFSAIYCFTGIFHPIVGFTGFATCILN